MGRLTGCGSFSKNEFCGNKALTEGRVVRG